MLFTPLIEKKRDGGALRPEEWRGAIASYSRGEIPDYQMAAMLMAVCWRGLSNDELAALTRAMLESGSLLGRNPAGPRRVGKHSTGGVGDKVSLVLAPLVASCGVVVPKMSGRGLGHTGGTTDKLEAIPGFRSTLTPDEVRAQLDRIGVALFGQSDEIAPADRKLYALRDVTGTVPSVPLIAASIMSKKLAESLDALVLDVKTGRGAFMTEPARAIELARTMVELGEASGVRTAAYVTAMDRPLGRAIGNALELEEALQALEGKGPDDLLTLTRTLATEMLLLGGVEPDETAARRRVDQALASGRALRKFRELVEAQGGNPAIVEDPGALPQAAVVELFEAPEAGTVTAVDPLPLGHAVVAMGGGRTRLGDRIDHSVGFVVSARPGMRVARGEPVASVFARDEAGAQLGLAALREAIRFDPAAEPLPLILRKVTAAGEQIAG
jgi:pyrimidine-nucleoside phosphorylase